MRHDECNETLLLMYLDGEGTPAERARIHAHLDACWLCRGRLAELERSLHQIADVMVGSVAHGFPEQKLAAARMRLNAAMAAERPVKTAPTPLLTRIWRIAWIPATAAAFTGGAIWVVNRPPAAPPAKPVAVVARLTVPVAPTPLTPPAPIITAPRHAVSPMPAGHGRPDLVRLALRVFETAHVLGFDVEKPLRVRIETASVRIAGLAPQEEHDLRLAMALPEAEATLLAGPDAALDSAVPTLEPPGVFGPDVPLDARLPLHAEIATAAGGEDKVKAFADRVVRSSEMLNRRVHALHELALALPETDEALLDVEGRARLSFLAADHFRDLESLTTDMRRQLAGLAGPVEGSTGAWGDSWQAIAAQWYTRYGPVHRAVLDLFTLHPERAIDRTASLAAVTRLWGFDAGLGWRPALTSRN